MKDNKSDESRRKLLKSIATGSGAIVAGKSLPNYPIMFLSDRNVLINTAFRFHIGSWVFQ